METSTAGTQKTFTVRWKIVLIHQTHSLLRNYALSKEWWWKKQQQQQQWCRMPFFRTHTHALPTKCRQSTSGLSIAPTGYTFEYEENSSDALLETMIINFISKKWSNIISYIDFSSLYRIRTRIRRLVTSQYEYATHTHASQALLLLIGLVRVVCVQLKSE